MRDVYVIATSCTAFGKRPGDSFKELTGEAYLDVLADARWEDGRLIEQAWFGNCGMGTFGQRNIRGQVCFTPLVRAGKCPERAPMINVEGGCATGSMAFHGAWKDVASGDMDVSMAIGVEKTFVQGDANRTMEIFEGGIDQLNPEEWHEYYTERGKESGKPFDPNAEGGTVFMDTYAMQAAWHMKTYGTTQEQIAIAASKNHWHGSMNPKAQYRFEVSVENAMADREVSWPITRSMAAPIGDGASAAILVSADVLSKQPKEVQARAIKVRASVLTGGKYREPSEPGLSHIAANKAYKKSGLTPQDVDLVELHDATSFCEIFQLEMLGFADVGKGGELVAEGATKLGGCLPVNLSGGLISKGHPVGATGLSMIHELTLQLRGEAGVRQTKNARIALAENGGGVIGFDEAACSVILLEAPEG